MPDKDLEALFDLTAEDEGNLVLRPSPEDLRAYLAGELTEDQEEILREHLSIDRAGARALLEIQALDQPDLDDEDEPVLSAEELAQDREILRARLGVQNDLVIVAAVAQRLRRYQLALAASCLLIFALSIGYLLPPGEPEIVAVQDHYLTPVGSDARGQSTDKVPLFIDRDKPFAYFTLAFVHDGDAPSMKIRVSSPEEPSRILSQSILPASPGPIRLRIRTKVLGNGPIRIELSGEPGNQPIAHYDLEVADSSTP